MTTQIKKWNAVGPNRDGCTDLPELDIPRWHAAGGQDIVIYGTDWTVEGTQEALDYVLSVYDLREITER